MLTHCFVTDPVRVNSLEHLIHGVFFLFVNKSIENCKGVADVRGAGEHKAEGGVPAAAFDKVNALLVVLQAGRR